jgi:hypothetical protein
MRLLAPACYILKIKESFNQNYREEDIENKNKKKELQKELQPI